MTWIWFFTSLFLFGTIIYLAYLNPNSVTFYLTNTRFYQVPMVVIILFSMLLGGLLVGITDLLKAIQRLWLDRLKRRQDRQERDLAQLIEEGNNYLRTMDNEKAKRSFQEVLRREPKHISALHYLGNLYHQEGKYREAITHFLKARVFAQKDTDKIDILYHLGAAYADGGHFVDAIEIFKELKEVDKNSYQPSLKLRNFYMAVNNWEEAYEVQKELLFLAKKGKDMVNSKDLSDLSPAILYEMGNTFLREQDYRKAVAKFKETIKLDPYFLPAYMALGEAYLRQDRADEAQKIWEKGYENTGSAVFLKKFEQFFYQAEMPNRLIERYRRAILENPSRPELPFLLAEAYLLLEMPDEALAEFKTVEQECGQYPAYYLLLARIYEKKKAVNEALEAYKTAFELQQSIFKPFTCKNCHKELDEWFDRCPSCRDWNTIDLNLIPTNLPST